MPPTAPASAATLSDEELERQEASAADLAARQKPLDEQIARLEGNLKKFAEAKKGTVEPDHIKRQERYLKQVRAKRAALK